MITDQYYQDCIRQIYLYGDELESRNYRCRSVFDLNPISFYSTPLVTLRKTAWKMALREMEWFMSGDQKCPDELLPWWSEQLSDECYYFDGYSKQFRRSASGQTPFDQIEYILNGLRTNPNSRRLVMTTWNPYEMAHITETNSNEKCPTCCHGSMVHFFVRDNSLFMMHYQRSADMLLGLPHNFIAYWALLLYFSYHANLNIGALRYIIGDAHIYCEPSHIDAVKAIIRYDLSKRLLSPPSLVYNGNGDCRFKASDFEMVGEIPEPVTTIRPKLL